MIHSERFSFIFFSSPTEILQRYGLIKPVIYSMGIDMLSACSGHNTKLSTAGNTKERKEEPWPLRSISSREQARRQPPSDGRTMQLGAGKCGAREGGHRLWGGGTMRGGGRQS